MSVVKPVSFSDSEFKRVNHALISYFRRRNYRHESEDLAAATWVDIIRGFEGRCSLRTFAFVVAKRKVADDRRRSYRRRRQARIEPLCDSCDEKIGNTPTVDGPSPESVLMLATGSEALARAVEQVWEPHRAVLLLWLEGYSPVEIAALCANKGETAKPPRLV